MTDYWLRQLLDDFGAKRPRDIDKLTTEDGFLRSATDFAAKAAERDLLTSRQTGDTSSVIAGHQFDLSGNMTCGSQACLIKEADEGLAQVWQLFDTAVVEGLGARRFMREIENGQPEYIRGLLKTHLAVLLHLRQIGAEPHIQFAEKPHAWCSHHYKEHAEQLGLPAALDDELAKAAIRLLREKGRLERKPFAGGSVLHGFQHPLFPGVRVAVTDSNRKISKRVMATGLYTSACTSLIGEVALAEALQYPLATDAWRVYALHGGRLEPDDDLFTEGLSESDVAISMQLPVLAGLTSREILRLRHEFQPEYVRFRLAVLEAIRTKVQQAGSADPSKVAAQVTSEFVDPALADVQLALKRSVKTLSTKSLPAIAVGAATTAVGILHGIPMIMGAGVTASMSSLRHLNKFRDRQEKIEESDMYFLWLANRKFQAH